MNLSRCVLRLQLSRRSNCEESPERILCWSSLMGKRKPPKGARSPKSIPSAQIGNDHKLRCLSEDEALHAYQEAKKAKKIRGPMHLLDAWWRWRHNHNLAGFVADLRDLIKDEALDDPSLV